MALRWLSVSDDPLGACWHTGGWRRTSESRLCVQHADPCGDLGAGFKGSEPFVCPAWEVCFKVVHLSITPSGAIHEDRLRILKPIQLSTRSLSLPTRFHHKETIGRAVAQALHGSGAVPQKGLPVHFLCQSWNCVRMAGMRKRGAG